MITCPNCGRLDKDEVQIYNENIDLRMFNLLLVFSNLSTLLGDS